MTTQSTHTVCQVSSHVPPSKDGVGDAAKKFHDMLLRRGIDSIIITSSDQLAGENIYPIVPNWGVSAIVPLLHTLKRRGITSVLFHYPSARFGRNVSIVFIPLLLRAAGIRTTLYLHEYADYSPIGKLRTILMTICVHAVVAADTPNLAGIRKVFRQSLREAPEKGGNRRNR